MRAIAGERDANSSATVPDSKMEVMAQNFRLGFYSSMLLLHFRFDFIFFRKGETFSIPRWLGAIDYNFTFQDLFLESLPRFIFRNRVSFKSPTYLRSPLRSLSKYAEITHSLATKTLSDSKGAEFRFPFMSCRPKSKMLSLAHDKNSCQSYPTRPE